MWPLGQILIIRNKARIICVFETFSMRGETLMISVPRSLVNTTVEWREHFARYQYDNFLIVKFFTDGGGDAKHDFPKSINSFFLRKYIHQNRLIGTVSYLQGRKKQMLINWMGIWSDAQEINFTCFVISMNPSKRTFPTCQNGTTMTRQATITKKLWNCRCNHNFYVMIGRSKSVQQFLCYEFFSVLPESLNRDERWINLLIIRM